MKIYFDGASAPKKKDAAGWGVEVQREGESFGFFGPLPPLTTNNEAEFYALYHALLVAKRYEECIILGDNEVVINMYLGVYHGKKPSLIHLKDRCLMLPPQKVWWVARKENPADYWAGLAKKISREIYKATGGGLNAKRD